MSTIINPAWKSKKNGDEVVFKGETYTIGSDAFGSIEAAVAEGETSDLVIVDKKLTSPVKKQNITGAATDIFASTYKETDSADGKTHTEAVKFAAAAGGTATFKDDDATLVGFEKVTANAAGGSFAAGKLDISSSLKEVDDSDKGIETHDLSATATSTATGSLSATGKGGTVSVAVSTIADSEGNIDKATSIIKDAYKEASGDDYKEQTGATYANVTLKLADLSTAINGGVITEKATIKTSDTNGEKINKDYSYSATTKVGSGTATLTDTNADDIVGFKTVKITASKDVKVGDLSAENESANYAKKSAFVTDSSFSYTATEKETESSAGTLTITGKASDKKVEVDGEIEGFSSMNLKWVTVNKEIETDSESSNSSVAVAVKNQKDVPALTVTLSSDSTKTADGSLTAANSTLGNLEGVKTVAISASAFSGAAVANATNTKIKDTKKVTGTATAGITENVADYVDESTWTVAADWEQAFTADETSKIENSVGGASFKVSGKTSADSTVNVYGYKTVALDNSDTTNTLTAFVSNNSLVNDTQSKVSFAPEKSYSSTFKSTTTDKAAGDATIKGKTSAGVAGFASVKVSGTTGKTELTGVYGQNTYSRTSTNSTAIKAGKENPTGTYSESVTESNKAASTLDVSKATISGTFTDLKTAKLQGVDSAAPVAFSGAVETNYKASKKVDWNADEISAAEAATAPAILMNDERVTAWNESEDTKESAAGTFALKNGGETVSVSANGFKSVDVAGTIGKTTLSGVIGQNTYSDKWSESLSVKGAKGTYSYSDTESRKAETSVTVSKATLAAGVFNNLKSVKLTDAAGAGNFTATVDKDEKYSQKYDWNTEEAAFKDLTGSIFDTAITSWNESDDTKESAAGTFALKNGATVDATVSAENFKSIDVSGAIDHTVLTGASGQDTYTEKWSETLSIAKAKGTYSYSYADSSKAATTLNVSNATINGAFYDLKSVTLKDVKVDTAPAAFTASLDSDSKETKKIDWNAEDATFADVWADGPFGESVTTWNWTWESKDSVVGSFSLANSKIEAVIADHLSIDNFKTVEISGVAALTVDSLWNAGDSSSKESLKRTVSETKRTQEVSESNKDTAVGSLKVTGKSGAATVLTVSGGSIGYSTITLKDAYIVGSGIAANAYAETEDYSAKETATLDSGSPTVVDLKVSYTHNKKGNGSFTADGSSAFTAFDGTLNGYTSISLKGKVSIGNVNNYKYDGQAGDTYTVPFAEYFDAVAYNYAGIGTLPADAVVLNGNVSGSYKMDKNGQIESKWTASAATTATGSFTQTATDVDVTAGSITGYDKVTLTGVKTVGAITGTNTEITQALNYKYAKDEEVANSKVGTTTWSSSSSVKVAGTATQVAEVVSIDGYKSVTLDKAKVTGTVYAYDETIVQTTDAVNNPDVIVEASTMKATGSLTATSSELKGDVDGFSKVELKNTKADGIDIYGGDNVTVDTYDTGMTPIETITSIDTATGSFSAISSEKSGDPKLSVVQSVGDVYGYAKVELKNYNAGYIEAASRSLEIIAADEDKETPKTWKTAAATKSNTFTASADSYVDGSTIKQNAITVGDVSGYGKVEATGLTEIGAIVNDFIVDSVVFANRIHSNTHFGDWSATAQETMANFTAITATAGSSVKVKGVSATGATPAPTAVTGSVAGYTTVQLDTVTLGDGSGPVVFAGGKYSFTTKTSNDEIVATSTSTADGKLDIKNATFVAGTTFGVQGFKTVAVAIDGDATFTDIIGGTEVAQFTDATLDYTTFKCADKATVTTEEGSVTGKVAGFTEVVFNDTNTGATSEIYGYEIGTKKVEGELKQTQTAKATVTFDDADDAETANSVAGKITNAKAIVFKSSTADASVDFNITAQITSLADEAAGVSGDLTITFDKCQATLSLGQLSMDDGDEIKLVSGTAGTATVDLGDIADVAALETLITNMSDVYISGNGDILFSTLDEQDFADTLAAAGFTWGDDVKFNGAHYTPTLA